MVALLACGAVACNMWSNPPKGWTGATGGEQLERLFWDDVKAKDVKNIEQHVASMFSGSGASGAMDREAFLRQLRSYQLTSVSLSQCSDRMNGGDLIVTCVVHREGTAADGAPAGTAATLSVWQQLKKGWVMVAHSETPLAASRS